MGVSLDLWLLKSRFNSERSLEEVQGGPHFADSPVVTSHVVEGHGLPQLIVLAHLLGLLEEVQGRVNVFLLKVVNC